MKFGLENEKTVLKSKSFLNNRSILYESSQAVDNCLYIVYFISTTLQVQLDLKECNIMNSFRRYYVIYT